MNSEEIMSLKEKKKSINFTHELPEMDFQNYIKFPVFHQEKKKKFCFFVFNKITYFGYIFFLINVFKLMKENKFINLKFSCI